MIIIKPFKNVALICNLVSLNFKGIFSADSLFYTTVLWPIAVIVENKKRINK